MAADVSKPGPFAILWDVIVAPKSAFEALDARPRWLVVYVVICALGMLGAILQIPIGEHVGMATLAQRAAHDPQMANMSPKQLANIQNASTTVQRFVWLMYPVIAIFTLLVAALFLLVGNAIGRGRGTFVKLFALATHVGIITLGINYALVGVLCSLHSPDAFNSESDILRLIPSLAWFVPDASPKLTVLLEAGNPFTIWSLILLALGMKTIAKVSNLVAYGTAAFVALGSLLFAVPLAQ